MRGPEWMTENVMTKPVPGIADGVIRYREDIVNGLEKGARSLYRQCWKGRNFGKLIVRVTPYAASHRCIPQPIQSSPAVPIISNLPKFAPPVRISCKQINS